MGLMMTTSSETMIAGNFRTGQEGLYAADAVLERAMDDLLTVPDWNTLLDGTVQSAFIDGPPSGSRTLPDGSTIDLTEAVNMANCSKVSTCSDADMNSITNAERPWGENNPRWKLYAYGNLTDMLPTDTINSPFYVLLMVADDPSETDKLPLKDGVVPCPIGGPEENQAPGGGPGCNPGTGVIALRAEAFGPRGAHKIVELTVARTDTTELERGYTGQRGQDEQNRRARKAAVQSPGKALTMQELNLATGVIQ
jgi:hypothetical protein